MTTGAFALDELRARGAIGEVDEHFARAIGRIGGEADAEVLLAAALASHAINIGDVCIDLGRLVQAPLRDEGGAIIDGHQWPALPRWRERVRQSPLVGDGRALTPLVLDPAGRLYLYRYWQHQTELATALRARAAQADEPLDASWVSARLDELFPRDPAAPTPDWQRVASALALQRRLCVISGGPGTGKTFTVVKILALLIEQAQRRGQPVPRMILLAPTGKAAARLAESISGAKSALVCDDEIKGHIPEQAATIHRCLSPIRGHLTEFRYTRDTPLLADVVLVDEASMVDLALMARLLAAVPPHARVILLGDKDQLASVEAGAVLSDICNADSARTYSLPWAARLGAASGEPVPAEGDAPAETGMWDCIVELQRSYRYHSDRGIGRLAHAINEGDAAAALALLTAPQPDRLAEVAIIEPGRDGVLSVALRDAVVAGFTSYLRQTDPVARLAAFSSFRVLCAHRRGPGGVEPLNQQIATLLREVRLIDGADAAEHYLGRPIMVTANDYGLHLFNGDVGLIDADTDRPDGRSAIFLGADGGVRRISPARLPPHETVFAMTVHKSQGSEFDEVAVVLPEQASAVLSRELLYTAVTRARRRVTIHATAAIVEQAILRRVERSSGLRDALWQR